MSCLGMSASLKARMHYGPKNKLRTNEDKISIVCFAGDINATFNREKKGNEYSPFYIPMPAGIHKHR